MDKKLETSNFFMGYEYDVIFLPMTMVKEIGKIVKENRIYDYGDQLIFAIEKFIVLAIGEKIQMNPKKKSWLERSISRLNLCLERTILG
jgi:hypothetical protein